MQHLEKIIFGVVLLAAVILVVGHGTSGVNVTRADLDADRLARDMQGTKEPAGAATEVPAAETALQAFIHTVETPPRASRWSFYRRPTLKGVEKKKPDTRKILEAPGLTVERADFMATLTWTDGEGTTAKITAYRIYRWVGEAKPDKNPVAELKPDVKEWTDEDAAVLQPEATVHYAVTAMTSEETRHGKPESPPSEPVTITLPYDRALVYYGSSWGQADKRQAEVLVRRWHGGEWRGPVRFTVSTGEVIGKKARIEVDGEQVELDFTTKWTLKDAVKSSEKIEVDGVERVVEKLYIEVAGPDGTVTNVMKSEKPKRDTPVKSRDPVSQVVFELFEEIKAAKDARDFDEAKRLDKLRDWVIRGKPRWYNSSRRALREEKILDELKKLGWDLEDETDAERPKPAKINEIKSKIEVLRGLRGPVKRAADELGEAILDAGDEGKDAEVQRLEGLLEWLNGGAARWYDEAERTVNTKQIATDVKSLETELAAENAKPQPNPSKIKELESKIAILKGLRK